MTFIKWIISGTACASLMACGEGVVLGDTATLLAQGAATYTGPVAINLGDTPLISENILDQPVLNDPDLLGNANIRTAFTETGATLDGDFTDFVGSDGAEYDGGLALSGGTISGASALFGGGGTAATAVVSGTLTGTGAGSGDSAGTIQATE